MVLVAVAWGLLRLGDREPEPWLLLVYPDSADPGVQLVGGEWDELESCRAGGVQRLAFMGIQDEGTYVCGRGCERGRDRLWECDETR